MIAFPMGPAVIFYKKDYMFNSYEDLMKEQSLKKYFKELGWKEIDSEGNSIPAFIFVLDVYYGYAVFRNGYGGLNLIHWDNNIDEATEFAVDRARAEIAEHEIKVKKD